jgi:transposase InsO family protein
LINEVFDRLRKARIFTKLDIRQGFHRIRMSPESEDLTTFRCRYGTYKYKVMPFGLTNGPATFQRLVNNLFMEELDQFMIAFVDDLLIYSDNELEHETHVKRVLEKLRSAGLQAALHKCEFHVRRTKFLGYIVSPDGIEVDQEKIEAITKWTIPTTVFGVRSFLGFCGFYRRFIKDYSKIVKPLNYLTRQDVPFKWTKECQTAFGSLKQKLSSAPILCHFQPGLSTRVETDASDGVIAAVLSQQQTDGLWHPCAFYSRTMNQAEFNYDIHDKELLAVVDALKEWRSELIGLQRKERFEILTDHQALQYFMTTKKLTGRQARWCETLHQYYFTLKHRSGKLNTLADALTRREGSGPECKDHRYQLMLPRECLEPSEHTENAESSPHSDTLDLVGISRLELANVETGVSIVARVVQANLRDQDCEEYRELAKEGSADWLMDEGLLLFKGRVYVPDKEDLRARLLDEIHRQPSMAHPGKNKMKILVRERYYWETWNKDVERYVDNCMMCKRTNTRRDLPPGLLQPLPIPSRTWQHISMDFMTYPKDQKGYDTVFVIVDRLSKIPISIPCYKDVDARQMAELWVTHAYRRTGPPDSIVSDRGSQFVSEFWKEVCRILGVKITLSTADHAQTDGQTEIANQYLSQRLRSFVNHFQDNWSDLLPIMDFAASALPQASTGMSPFMIEKGFQPRTSFDWKTPQAAGKLSFNQEQARAWTKRFQEVWDVARSNLESAQEQQKRQADKHRRKVDFDIGDQVMVSTKRWDTGRPSKKLDNQAAGPFPIVEKVGHAYRVKLDDGIRVHDVFAPEKLRRATSSEPLRGQVQDPAPPIEVNNEKEWEVEEILDSRVRWKKLFYRVKWTGHDPDSRWYLASDFKNAPRRLKAFHDRYPGKPGPPINLDKWLAADENDIFLDNNPDDARIKTL